MIDRNFIVNYLNNLLNCDKFNDYAPNGLQIEGTDKINKICTAVTASEKVIETAITLCADMLLVHHGFFWKGEVSPILGPRKRKFSAILKNNLNLCAYHLPLDAHLDFGNNACLGRILKLKNVNFYAARGIPNILWVGELNANFTAEDFSQFLEKNIQKPIYLSGGSHKIRKIAWCSGAAQDFIEDVQFYQVDAFISGEASERTFYQAQELNIHFYACGHHATERYGVQALGSHLANKFDIQHEFIDVNNPI